MGVDINIFALNSKKTVWIGRAYYSTTDTLESSTREYTAQELLSLINGAIQEKSKEYLRDEDADESVFYPFLRAKVFVESHAQDTFYYINDCIDDHINYDDYQDADLPSEQIDALVRAHVNSLEIVIWNGYHGYLAVTKEDFDAHEESRKVTSPITIKARLLGVKDRTGNYVYVDLDNSWSWRTTDKYHVADR